MKFTRSQTGQQITTVQILLNISRYKDNQGMKSGFGYLTEYNMRIIFLEKSLRTANELNAPWEKNTGQLKSLTHACLFLLLEWLNLLLKHLINLGLILDFSNPLTFVKCSTVRHDIKFVFIVCQSWGLPK